MRRIWLCLAVSIGACRSPHGEPGGQPFDARAAPEQRPLAADDAYTEPAPPRTGVRFAPQARYRIAARVLSTERYYRGWSGDVLPIDLALGWGAMSDPRVDEWIEWYQRDRYYFWQWDAGSPYRNAAIRDQSANVHIAPGTENLRRALLALEPGDLALLAGWLVNVDGPGEERFRTSLSRSDTGANSCEVLHVTELTIGGKIYR